MATIRKPARCDCGAMLKTYVKVGKGMTTKPAEGPALRAVAAVR